MSLRRRLLWLLAPPLVVALVLIYLLAHGLLLGRLDQEDEQRLIAQATQIRALLNNQFERDRDRLQSFVQALAPESATGAILPVLEATLSRMNVDFLVRLDAQGRVSAAQWLPVEMASLVYLDTALHPSQQALRDEVLHRVERLGQAGEVLSGPGQLLAVQGVPMILVGVAVDPARSKDAGVLYAGHFLNGTRIADLQRQLNGALRLLPYEPVDGAQQIAISPRQVLDDTRQRIFLLFNNGTGERRPVLELTRDRYLYKEGKAQINLFFGVSALLAIIAWLLIYLGLEWFVLRRISRMHQQFLHIGPDTAGQRLSDRGQDELGMLALAANRMLDRLEQSEARDRAILRAMQEGYFELDTHGRLQSANPAFCRLLGLAPQSITGRNASEWLQACDEARLRTLFETCEQGDAPAFAGRIKRADGSVGHYETHLSVILDHQAQVLGYRGILHDVSDHVEYQNQLYDLAYLDALTRLGNRKAFYEHLTRSLADAKGSVALLFIDLDRFKQVNDRFGHDVGDSLLVNMANRLRDAVRKPDRAYRLGGDEFTLILPGTDEQDAERLAQRLLQVLGEPVQLDEQVIDFVTPSIGIALYPQHAQDLDSLVKAADQAMYEAKRQRNQVCLYQPLSVGGVIEPAQEGRFR
ncbi:diguanylate cyclase domain-containing protein [Pseudomonas monteilii]|uniref:diguanylate cyclase domain-containing protein n=1 Tax=Pseudomonas monteilii TaxID=76759 RepID=UPI00086367D1|nr:diguanylate cyclase [Pseudomonas monteilii]